MTGVGGPSANDFLGQSTENFFGQSTENQQPSHPSTSRKRSEPPLGALGYGDYEDNTAHYDWGGQEVTRRQLRDLIIAVAGMLKSRGRVRLDREPFRVLKKEVTGEGALLYEARVDGIVMEKGLQNIQGFMEVKRDLRRQKKEVRMQQGAQMAAFVYSKGSSTEATSKRWMISMDRHEGFITIATYKRNYVDFLYGKPANGNDCYMTMYEYGPFDLRLCQPKAADNLEAFLKAIAVLVGL